MVTKRGNDYISFIFKMIKQKDKDTVSGINQLNYYPQEKQIKENI